VRVAAAAAVNPAVVERPESKKRRQCLEFDIDYCVAMSRPCD